MPPIQRAAGQELWGNLSRCSERGIEDSQILIDCSARRVRRKSVVAFDPLLPIGIGLNQARIDCEAFTPD